MKNQSKLLIVLAFVMGIFISCNNAKKEQKFELDGTITGIKVGKINLVNYSDPKRKTYTAEIKEGKFKFEIDFKVPQKCGLYIDGKSRNRVSFYAENVKMTFTGDAQKINQAKIDGCQLNIDSKRYYQGLNKIKAKLRAIYNKFGKNTSDKDKATILQELQDVGEKVRLESESYFKTFIKENPKCKFSAVLLVEEAIEMSGNDMMKLVELLDPKLQKSPILTEFINKAKGLQKVEVSLNDFMKNVNDVNYKADTKFEGTKYTNIKYLANIENKNICALKDDGTIFILDSEGKELTSFKAKINGIPSSIATDTDNNIYILSCITKVEIKKFRGKERKRRVPIGVECGVFDKTGKKINKLELKDLKTATGARVVENNLIVSDCSTKKLVIFNKSTGKKSAEITDMRPCCGILDFSVNDKKEILVADLGAFRVQGFNFKGEKTLSFGKRGRGLNEFHGCCNPVSVAYLNGGAIVTVEKSPTRIKIYSKQGAKQIQGIQELVKGCSYIPMTVDCKDNLYLASPKKGIVKCIAAK